MTEETGVTVVDVQNRMVDFGIDAFWLSHEPWIVPEPFTPEAGEMWSKEDIDYWIDVLAAVVDEAYEDPRDREDGAAQPGDPQGRRLGRRRPRALGDDLARLSAQARRPRGRVMTDRVAIVGAGSIGSSWAIVFARAGHAVALYDPDPTRLPAAAAEIEMRLAALAQRRPAG